MLDVLFIVNHVLLNSIAKLSKKLYTVSEKMFTVSTISMQAQIL